MAFITYSMVKGGGLPLGLKVREISFSLNSCASLLLPVRKRSSRRFNPSTDSRRERTFLFWCSWLKIFSHPDKSRTPAPRRAPNKNFRPEMSNLFFSIAGILRLYFEVVLLLFKAFGV